MSNNNFDIFITRKGAGWEVKIDYWHYNRDKENPRMTSRTTYVWYTECREIIDKFQNRRTNIFYSQLRVLARLYGRREKEKFNFVRNVRIV